MKLRKIPLLLTVILYCFPAVGQTTYSICTFNMRIQSAADRQNQWYERKDSVIMMLRECDFDVLGAQEDQINFHLKDLASLSDTYRSYSSPARPQYDASGNTIFYKYSKFVLMKAGTFWLSETPDVPYSIGWDSARTRNCNWIKLFDVTNGNVFYVFNTHLDHKGAVARAEGAKLILQRVKEIAGNEPVFVIGDFNEGPDKNGVKEFRAELFDTMELALKKEGPAFTFPGWERNLTSRIDYIFTNEKEIKVFEHVTYTRDFGMFGLYRMYSSDHYPVYIKFEL